jgi:hypothetical protein
MLLRFRPSRALMRDSPSRKLALESHILVQATSGRVGAAHSPTKEHIALLFRAVWPLCQLQRPYLFSRKQTTSAVKQTQISSPEHSLPQRARLLKERHKLPEPPHVSCILPLRLTTVLKQWLDAWQVTP